MLPFIHIGPLQLGTYGILVATAAIVAYFVLRADLRRRRLPDISDTVVLVVTLAGIVGAKLYHVLETPSQLAADPVGELFSRAGFAWAGSLIAGVLALLWLARRFKIPVATMFDVVAPAAALGYAIGLVGCLISGDGDYGIPTSLPWGMSFPNGLVPTTQRVHPTPLYEFFISLLIAGFLWRMGAKSVRGPKATGEIFCSYLILSGVARFLVEFIRINPRSFFGLTNAQAAIALSVIAGGVLLWQIKRQFHKMKKEHRILAHAAVHGEVLQPEYHAPTPECPHPERWRMLDSMTAE